MVRCLTLDGEVSGAKALVPLDTSSVSAARLARSWIGDSELICPPRFSRPPREGQSPPVLCARDNGAVRSSYGIRPVFLTYCSPSRENCNLKTH